MKKSFWVLCLLLCLYGFPASAHEEDMVHYAVPQMQSEPQMKKYNPEEDTLDDGTDIKPLSGQLSQAEKLQENSSDLDYIDNEQGN